MMWLDQNKVNREDFIQSQKLLNALKKYRLPLRQRISVLVERMGDVPDIEKLNKLADGPQDKKKRKQSKQVKVEKLKYRLKLDD